VSHPGFKKLTIEQMTSFLNFKIYPNGLNILSNKKKSYMDKNLPCPVFKKKVQGIDVNNCVLHTE